MNRIAEALGLNSGVTDPRNRVVWHTLRHTFATRMLESGVDIYTLKELLGHSSVAVTEGYLHLCDRAKREKALARLTLERAVTSRGHQLPLRPCFRDRRRRLPGGSRPAPR